MSNSILKKYNGSAWVPVVVGAKGEGVPLGGTTGQVLAKNSNTDLDTEWVTVQTSSGAGETFHPFLLAGM